MQRFGIDISRHQGAFSLTQARNEGVEFAILKIGGGDDGLYKDSRFDDFYSQSRAIEMPVGCYFFGQAMTKEQAIKEADYWLSLMAGKKFEYPVFYDVEAQMLQLSPDVLTDIILTVVQRVELQGYWVGIYSSIDFFNYNMQDQRLVNYSHWVASWGANKPTLQRGGETQMWQFGGETNKIRSNKICGVTCDQNYCYVDYPTQIKANGLNNYNKEDITPAPEKPDAQIYIVNYLVEWKEKFTDEIAKGVVDIVIDKLIEDIKKDFGD